jgi:hypothetical protein
VWLYGQLATTPSVWETLAARLPKPEPTSASPLSEVEVTSMSLAHHYADRALQFRVSQNAWVRKPDYSKMLGGFTLLMER